MQTSASDATLAVQRGDFLGREQPDLLGCTCSPSRWLSLPE